MSTIAALVLGYICHNRQRLPQVWQTASVCVLELVLLLVSSGMTRIIPSVQMDSKIQHAQPKQPRCFVLVSVTACTVTFSLRHLGQVMASTP